MVIVQNEHSVSVYPTKFTPRDGGSFVRNAGRTVHFHTIQKYRTRSTSRRMTQNHAAGGGQCNGINYEGYSKINIRLFGKNKRVVIASKRTLSSNKELLFLLYAYPHTFSPRSVGVNTDETWTLSSPLPPAVRYVL